VAEEEKKEESKVVEEKAQEKEQPKIEAEEKQEVKEEPKTAAAEEKQEVKEEPKAAAAEEKQAREEPTITPEEKQKEEEPEEEEEEEYELKDQVISIRRVSKVVKGGKNLSFSALAAVGNENGLVGIGKGKAREVPQAIAKAVENAKKSIIKVPLSGTTIPHFIKGEAGGGLVILRPASEGTGVIAGGAVRVIMELAGIKDILTKSIRSNNPISVANATVDALKKIKNPEEVSKIRGKIKEEIWQ
jgi:small subunit ribosomal protein S5